MNSTVPVTISGFWIFLADLLPVRDVGEQPLVGLEVFFVLDALRQRQRLAGRRSTLTAGALTRRDRDAVGAAGVSAAFAVLF